MCPELYIQIFRAGKALDNQIQDIVTTQSAKFK